MSDSQSLAAALAEAVDHHRAGRLDDAQRLYRAVLDADPAHPIANYNGGLLAMQTGRPDLALKHFQTARAGLVEPELDAMIEAARTQIETDAVFAAAVEHHLAGRLAAAEAGYRAVLTRRPDHVAALGNHAVTLGALGRIEAAEEAFHQALALDPAYACGHNNLGALLNDQGRWAEAEASCRRAVAIRPDYAEARNNLAIALLGQGRAAAAEPHCRRAVAVRPDYAEAWNTLGNVLLDLGRLVEALDCFGRSAGLKPLTAEAHNNLGNALHELGRRDEAEASFRRAVALRPDFAEALSNLGNTLVELGRADEAEACCRRAIEIRPDFVAAWSNRAIALKELGRLDDARDAVERALALRPDHAAAHVERAFLLLLQGQCPDGWAEYHWRWALKAATALDRFGDGRPLWRGEPAAGRTILVWAEQGLGDTLQFCRYVPLLARAGWRVVAEAPAPFRRLLTTLEGLSGMVESSEDPPPFDVHCPLLDLPRVLGTTLESIPDRVPYLRPDPGLTGAWRRRLAELPGIRIGIAWRGNPGQARDRRRSTTAEWMARWLDHPGLALVSLQRDATADELAALAAGGRPLLDAAPRLGDLADTAALMATLDLVVTVDTAICHLAGALAVPTWTMLDFAADWRWLTGRKDSPWYPSMRLFRQPAPGDWNSVGAMVGEALARHPWHGTRGAS